MTLTTELALLSDELVHHVGHMISPVMNIAYLFYGEPQPNGVFSAALGLQARAVNGDHVRMVSAEGNTQRCDPGKKVFATNKPFPSQNSSSRSLLGAST